MVDTVIHGIDTVVHGADVVVTGATVGTDDSLKLAARPHGVLYGAGMRNWSVFTGTAGLQDLVEYHFDALVPGNALKWVNTEPTQGSFSFTEADDFIAWADARSMYTRCHTLVWHTSLAPWVAGAVNASTWQGIIDTHIGGVLGHYPGRVWDVDVVNEAFRHQDGLPGGFRNSLWAQAAGGGDYVPYAFERARAHAPSALLYLADFGLEQIDGATKRGHMLTALQDWLSQGVPIDGVAIHGHLNPTVALNPPALRLFIQALQLLGLRVIISEFDFRSISALGLSDAAAFQYIGAYAEIFLDTVFDAGVNSVYAWGVSPADWAGTPTEQIAAVPFGYTEHVDVVLWSDGTGWTDGTAWLTSAALWSDGTGWTDGTAWLTSAVTFFTTPIYDAMIAALQEDGLEEAEPVMAYDVAIGWDNRIDTALLTVTNQINTAQVTNLKTADVRQVWRAASNTVAIRADFGTSILWGGTALLKSNAAPGDTMRVALSTTDATGLARDAYDSGTISTGVDPAFGVLVHFPEQPVMGRHLRIDLTQTSPPEAGRWFAGPVWRPSRAFAYGWEPTWRDASRDVESLGQNVFTDRKIRQRGFRFVLRGITEAEADDQVHEINRVCGTSRDILVCRNMTATNLGKSTIWGKLQQPIRNPQPHPDFYEPEVQLWERL